MITAVDSSILLDVFTNAPPYADKSSRALKAQLKAGSLVACEVVWAEVASFFPRPHDLCGIMRAIGIDFSACTEDAALAAATAWKAYRKAGGKRERVVADFIIGAHALTNCDCLLTRDRGFYRSYFKGLNIIALD